MRSWLVERRQRTRHLIELGGLVVKAGIVDLTGDDRAMIYGALVWMEASPSFLAQFGLPSETHITLNHPLGPVLPINRKMTSPRTLSLTDRNGDPHECVAEAFDTTHNILILLYPVQALGKPTIIVPAGFDQIA
jgi:hypothetical protein